MNMETFLPGRLVAVNSMRPVQNFSEIVARRSDSDEKKTTEEMISETWKPEKAEMERIMISREMTNVAIFSRSRELFASSLSISLSCGDDI